MYIISHGVCSVGYKQQRLLIMANTSLCDYTLRAFFTSYLLADRDAVGAEERGNKCQEQASDKPKKERGWKHQETKI